VDPELVEAMDDRLHPEHQADPVAATDDLLHQELLVAPALAELIQQKNNQAAGNFQSLP
jgi:hypothetical protein